MSQQGSHITSYYYVVLYMNYWEVFIEVLKFFILLFITLNTTFQHGKGQTSSGKYHEKID